MKQIATVASEMLADLRPHGMPMNLDAERFVLGVVLLDDSNLDDISTLGVDDFSLHAHQLIYRQLRALKAAGEKIDRVTVADRLMAANQLDAVGGFSYLISLDNGLPDLFSLEAYVRIVRGESQRRKLILSLEEAQHRAYDRTVPVAEVRAQLAQRMEDFAAVDPRESASLSEVIAEVGMQELIGGSVSRGITPGFDGLAGILRHWRPAELTILAARPGWGKTAFALQEAVHVAKRGHRVLIVSKEMRRDATLRRMIAQESHTNPYGWADADADMRRELVEAVSRLDGLDIHISKRPEIEVADYVAEFSRVARVKPIDFVVVDYLQLFHGDKRENRNNALETVLREIYAHALAKNYHVLVLCQLSREAEKEFWARGLPPSTATLRDSGAIEQIADNIIFLWPDKEDFELSQADPYRTSVKTPVWVKKQRNGNTGMFPLDFYKHHTRFVEQTRAVTL